MNEEHVMMKPSMGSNDTYPSDFTSLSCNSENIDINFICISKKPPPVPLREEMLSSGFEVMRSPKGTGARAIFNQSQKKQKELIEVRHEKKKEVPTTMAAVSCETYFARHLMDKARKRSLQNIAKSRVVRGVQQKLVDVRSILDVFSHSVNSSIPSCNTDISDVSCSSTSCSESDVGKEHFFDQLGHLSDEARNPPEEMRDGQQSSRWWFDNKFGSDSSSMCFAPSLGTACTSSSIDTRGTTATDISDSDLLLT